ncbi:MAG: transposase [Atribacterota bacterium]|nr:transposase [Atribacterota bacterium]
MPRSSRLKSSTGYHHIMLRGINRSNIFESDQDKAFFLNSMYRARKKGSFRVIGYCLMNTHVHLLLQESEEIGVSIKRITVSYVQWFNRKYNRVGHLFQNRYKSEPIEDERYLMAVLRYIHQNPIKAGMAKTASKYNWSSYNEYLKMYNSNNYLIDGEIMKAYFDSKKSFTEFHKQMSKENYMDYENINRYSADELLELFKKKISIDEFHKLPFDDRANLIKDIYHETGTSIRDLSRGLGIGRSIVERAVKI